jgi:hypothetical protein
MIMYRYVILCALFFFSSPVWAGEVVFPVANGRNTQTITQVQEKVRAFRQAHPNTSDDLVIEFAGGLYELEQPISLGPEDGGTELSRTIWRAKTGATVRLLGGKILRY